MPKLHVILDPGHSISTAGKRSPVWEDGSQLLEYEFNRAIVNKLAALLKAAAIKYTITCPTEKGLAEDASADLVKRVNLANALNKKSPTLFLSIHGNAFNGKARGFEFYTSLGETSSDRYASIIASELQQEFPNDKFRADYADGDIDKESPLYVTKHTDGAAVLAELLFFDNYDDCKIMMSEVGQNKMVKALFNAIIRILAC